MSLIKPGPHMGRITNYGVTKTSKGDPQAMITFDIESDGKTYTMTWYGSFKEGKAREITLKALQVCGAADDLTPLAEGPASGFLDQDKEVLLTVEHEINQKGGTTAKIRWINSPHKFAELVPRAEVSGLLASMKGSMMALRAQTGIKSKEKPKIKNMAPKARNPAGDDDDDSIPF